MKIVKRGTPPGDRIWEGNCRVCGTEAECPESELTNYTSGDYRSEGPFSWEVCPVCYEPKLLMKLKTDD